MKALKERETERERKRERVYVWHIRGTLWIEVHHCLLYETPAQRWQRWTALRPVCVCVWPYICLQLTKLTQSHSIEQPVILNLQTQALIDDIIQDEPHALMIVNTDWSMQEFYFFKSRSEILLPLTGCQLPEYRLCF